MDTTAHIVAIALILTLIGVCIFGMSVYTFVASVNCEHGVVFKSNLKAPDTCDVSYA